MNKCQYDIDNCANENTELCKNCYVNLRPANYKPDKCIVTITTIDKKVVKEPFGEEDRCSNCGKPISQSKVVITGSVDEEWGCCGECINEMEEKGCSFEELGQYVYRQQKY